MSSPQDLQRAVDEFHATLDALSFTGLSQIGEVAQLKVLITKYPQHARAELEALDKPRNRDDR